MNKTDIIIKKLDAILELLQSKPRESVSINKKTCPRCMIHQRIKEGVRLLALKRETPHGYFQARIRDEGINVKLACKLMQVSSVFMDESKLQYPSLHSFKSWSIKPEVAGCINSFIGESDSWKALLRSRNISV